jgi:LytR cell envelope-related transcriptional attenuator
MSMISGGNLSPSSGPNPPRSRLGVVVLVGVLAVVLFGAGVGLSVLLRGGTDEAAQPVAEPTCVTTTTVPEVTLPKPGTVSVNVYNATDRSGLAASTGVALKGRGFNVGEIANDPLGKNIKGVAQLRYGTKGESNAELLVFYFPGAKLVADDRTDASVDVVLGAKFDSVESTKKVRKATTKPVVTSEPPGCASSPASPGNDSTS